MTGRRGYSYGQTGSSSATNSAAPPPFAGNPTATEEVTVDGNTATSARSPSTNASPTGVTHVRAACAQGM
eukprot:gene11226-biopygen9022